MSKEIAILPRNGQDTEYEVHDLLYVSRKQICFGKFAKGYMKAHLPRLKSLRRIKLESIRSRRTKDPTSTNTTFTTRYFLNRNHLHQHTM